MRTLLLLPAVLLLASCTDDTEDTGVVNTPPQVTITAPEDGAGWSEGEDVRLKATVLDDWTALSDLAVSWTVDGVGPLSGSATVNGDTLGLDVTTELPGGEHVLRLVVADEHGAETEASVNFSVDGQEPPTVSLLYPAAEGAYGEGDRVPVEASFYDPDEDSVTDLVVTWGGIAEGLPAASDHPEKDGRIAFELENLDIGTHTLSVEVSDGAGSTASANLWFEVIGWDADGDGYDSIDLGGKDCDDDDGDIHPGVDEVCNDRDDDCDGRTDEEPPDDGLLYFGDNDEDGYGSPFYPLRACSPTTGYVDNDGDCDDTDAGVHPGVTEVCDGIDNDCNGILDGTEAVDAATLYLDVDDDGYGGSDGTKLGCEEEPFYAFVDGDCDDADPLVNPGATEVCDGLDNDCADGADGADASDADTWYQDADEDGYGALATATNACEEPSGWILTADDCDDSDDGINPDATEVCDTVDNNCDGTTDEDTASDASIWYLDLDGDGHGDPDNTTLACSQPSNATGDSSDCDDTDSTTSPSATEYCDGGDDDCDGSVDEQDAWDVSTWYADADADGFGDSDSTMDDCYEPSGYVSVPGDCDDDDSSVNPAAIEYCDAIDNDCDGTDDPDSSADAVAWYTDADGDGYADPTSSVIETSCYGTDGLAVDPSDCDDGEAETYPGADEQCNSVDDDCDGSTDEDPVDGDWYTLDADGDGFGETDGWYWGCDGADNDLDCDDGDPTEPHVVDGGSATTSPGGSADDPWLLIQDGINNAGRCVAVFPGTYSEALDYAGNDVDVRSVYGPSLTTIDASGLGASVAAFQSGESSDAGLEGFTLTHGEGHVDVQIMVWTCESRNSSTGDICSDVYQTWCGGGVYVNGSTPTLRNLVIQDNELEPVQEMQQDNHGPGGETYMVYSFGGGVCVMNATLAIEDVEVIDNYADQGGGIYIDESSQLSLNGVDIRGNQATDGGGIQVDGGQLYATNAVIAVNLASSYGAGVMVSDGSLNLTNVTVGLNSASTADGVFVYGTSIATLQNSIIYGRGSGTGVYVDSGGTLTATHTDVSGFDTRYSGVSDPSGSDGNLSEDPEFAGVSDDADHTNDDWTLASSSPCVDAGDSDSAYDDADGTTNDMGAYGGPNGAW